MTLVLLGSGVDAALDNVASALAGDAVVIRPADLSRRGWSLDLGSPMSGTFVATGVVHANSDVTRIVVATRVVQQGELVWFDESTDRHYAAVEMTALLRAWLGMFPQDVVVGAPDGEMLSGSRGHEHRWESIAAQAGLAVEQGASGSEHWACQMGATTLGSHPLLRGVVDAIWWSRPASYFWLDAESVAGCLTVRNMRDYPKLDDPRECQAIIDCLKLAC